MRDYSNGLLRVGHIEKAHLAVDFFFILSGFILAHVYGREFSSGRASWKDFLIARFARIYPAHLTIMILFLVYISVFGSIGFNYNLDRYRVDTFIEHILLIDAWGVSNTLSWNYPSWSISAEFFAYFLFPILVIRVYDCHVAGVRSLCLCFC